MVIDKNAVVSLHYKLQKDNADGDLIEETAGGDPLVFLFGVGQMLPSFEENLEGKAAGDTFAFKLESTEAYGPYEKESVVPVPKNIFVDEKGVVQEDILIVGNSIPLQDQSGRQLVGKVVEIQEEQVVLDFNHPMAGENLYFTGKIESLRAATETEIEHGHVHGPGGHAH